MPLTSPLSFNDHRLIAGEFEVTCACIFYAIISNGGVMRDEKSCRDQKAHKDEFCKKYGVIVLGVFNSWE